MLVVPHRSDQLLLLVLFTVVSLRQLLQLQLLQLLWRQLGLLLLRQLGLGLGLWIWLLLPLPLPLDLELLVLLPKLLLLPVLLFLLWSRLLFRLLSHQQHLDGIDHLAIIVPMHLPSELCLHFHMGRC